MNLKCINHFDIIVLFEIMGDIFSNEIDIDWRDSLYGNKETFC